MSSIGSVIDAKIKKTNDFDFQSLQMTVGLKGQRQLLKKWGHKYTYFDLASLTKVIFTTLWFMEAYQCDKRIVQQNVTDLLPWYPHPAVSVRQLLTHSAGNEWWQPFYKEISGGLKPEQAYQQMEKQCQKAPLSKVKKAVYSDLDFYLLGSIMQKVEGQPLIAIWNRIHKKFYPKSQFHFNYQNTPLKARTLYAPTEACPWRKKTMRGEVHDENCWALGGIAPHAGLFGRIEDLEIYGNLIFKISKGKNRHIKASVLETFQKRALPKDMGDWGLGFMKPSQQSSSAGEWFSKKSFGHTGFTGTSFWYDPTRELFVATVSNRVHPTRDNKGYQRLRPQLHDWVVSSLEETK